MPIERDLKWCDTNIPEIVGAEVAEQDIDRRFRVGIERPYNLVACELPGAVEAIECNIFPARRIIGWRWHDVTDEEELVRIVEMADVCRV